MKYISAMDNLNLSIETASQFAKEKTEGDLTYLLIDTAKDWLIMYAEIERLNEEIDRRDEEA
jgi:hypothetical protein